MSLLVYVVLIFVGLCLGSFVNALVWRLHEQDELKGKKGKKASEQLKALSILRGHSMCSYCHHPLAPIDLVPVFSWIWLRGKCRYCHHKIEDTPIAELLTAILFVISYAFWPVSLHGFGLVQFCFWLTFVVGFVALAIYDVRWYLLPDRIVYPLIVLASLQTLIHIAMGGGIAAVFSAIWGVAIASGIFFVLFQVSKGAWIGGGDVKLGVILGLILGGPMHGFLLLFISSLLGTAVSIPLLTQGRVKKNSLIPYGPFLLAATFIITLFGDRILDWFNSLFVG